MSETEETATARTKLYRFAPWLLVLIGAAAVVAVMMR
jgi:hypothetical protein